MREIGLYARYADGRADSQRLHTKRDGLRSVTCNSLPIRCCRLRTTEIGWNIKHLASQKDLTIQIQHGNLAGIHDQDQFHPPLEDTMNAEIKKLNQDAEQYAKNVEKAIIEMQKVIVGQEEILRKLMIALIADGHVLLDGG